MRIVSHFILVLFCWLALSASALALTPVLIDGKTDTVVDIHSDQALILDSVPDMSVQDAQKRLTELLDGGVRSSGCSDAGCWIALRIESTSDDDVEHTVYAFTSAQFFVVRSSSGITELRPSGNTGTPRSEHERYTHFVLHHGEMATLLVRELHGSEMFPLRPSRIVDIEPFIQFLHEDTERDELGFTIVGALVALGLYNLFLARAADERSYYFYCLYLFFMTISTSQSFLDNAIGRFFFPDHPGFGPLIQHFTECFMWLGLIAFARSFLDTKRYLPRFDRLWLIPLACGLGGLVLGLAGSTAWEVVAYLGYAIPAPLGVAAAYMRMRQGYRPARFFLAAQLVLATGVLLQAGENQDLIHLDIEGELASLLWQFILWVTSVIEAVIFSLALADRFKSLTQTVADQTISHLRDRETLIQAQNEKLEVEVAERTRELQQEKLKSDHLLLSVLPADIAEELKTHGTSRPRRYDDVSIMFTDFRNFTTTVSALPADRLVSELNDIFQSFDEILLAHGVEKIKTIGDSYMVAAGLPEVVADHASRCVGAALEMLAFIAQRNQSSAIKWGMRAGIHSGAVVAGIVGKTKFAFDVFGDTVNIASRMESNSEPGRLNVSAYTYDLIRSEYQGSYRGKVEVKGKGEIDMYFIESTPVAASLPA